MGLSMVSIALWTTTCLWIAVHLAVVSATPISISFDVCQQAVYPVPADPTRNVTLNCCPPKHNKAIVDGLPKATTSYPRIRKASQCTDQSYAKKLAKGYKLMRELPDDDPRSLYQQWHLHCSYCGGSFIDNTDPNDPMAIDIHWSWLFYPWHRYYIYFHERILQSLLDDPEFSLSYWNWDNPFNVEGEDGYEGYEGESCLKASENFPSAYSDEDSATYIGNRSEFAKGRGRILYPDLNFNFQVSAANQTVGNGSSLDQLLQGNLNTMYQSMVSGGTTEETFLGQPYRAGEPRGRNGGPTRPDGPGGGGFLEAGAHTSVHSWVGKDPPDGLDMGSLAYAARDPVFFAHHSNIDRLFQVWKDIGPVVGQTREYYTDPDFLNAEFLFFDENKDLRRVKVKDSLDTNNLGYVYQGANDAAWIYYNQTRSRCNQENYTDIVKEAEELKKPKKDSDGYYNLKEGEEYTMVLDVPEVAAGTQQFLAIEGIKLDRQKNIGFDVYLNLLEPREQPNPYKCAEYVGRFASMGQGQRFAEGKRDFVWKQCVSTTLADIHAPSSSSSKVTVTLVPMSGEDTPRKIKFKSIDIVS